MIKPGYTKEVGIREYHQDNEYWSSSRMKPALKSFKHLYYSEEMRKALQEMEDPEDKVEHFEFGNAVECAILEPDLFDDKVKVWPGETYIKKLKERRPGLKNYRASKEYQELYKWYKLRYWDKYIISDYGPHSFWVIQHILNNVYASAMVQQLLKGVEHQYSIFWEHSSGLKLKTRPDICQINKSVLVDLKTTDDASPKGFKNACYKYDYFFQAALQILGAETSGLIKKVDAYFWLVVEKSQPYNVQLYRLDPDWKDDLLKDLNTFLSYFQEQISQEHYPGYESRADNKYGVLDIAPFGYEILKTR